MKFGPVRKPVGGGDQRAGSQVRAEVRLVELERGFDERRAHGGFVHLEVHEAAVVQRPTPRPDGEQLRVLVRRIGRRRHLDAEAVRHRLDHGARNAGPTEAALDAAQDRAAPASPGADVVWLDHRSRDPSLMRTPPRAATRQVDAGPFSDASSAGVSRISAASAASSARTRSRTGNSSARLGYAPPAVSASTCAGIPFASRIVAANRASNSLAYSRSTTISSDTNSSSWPDALEVLALVGRRRVLGIVLRPRRAQRLHDLLHRRPRRPPHGDERRRCEARPLAVADQPQAGYSCGARAAATGYYLDPPLHVHEREWREMLERGTEARREDDRVHVLLA